MTLIELFELLRNGGETALLVAAIFGGAKGVYVWSWVYEAKVKECDEWKTIALQALHVADRVVAK